MGPGVNVINLFPSAITIGINKLECTWKVFHASLRFADGAWNLPIEWVTASCYTWIGSGHICKKYTWLKVSLGTNYLAYLTPLSVTKKKIIYADTRCY